MRLDTRESGPGVPEVTTRSSSPQLLHSRLRPPHPLLELVSRDRLVRDLANGKAPLVVVSTPGGFGKTVALSQWAETDWRPFGWLQADEADNDPLALLSYLVAALDGVISLDPMTTEWLELAPPPVAMRVLPALAQGVSAAGPFVLVVDDAHLVTNEACWGLLGALLQQLPPGAQLCLSGRHAPPLPLAKLRASGGLQEFGPRDLALTAMEIRELLGRHGLATDDDTVTYLDHVTEGWAAGVYLAALAGTHVSTGEWLGGIRGRQRDIAGYLASEVLDRQSPG